MVHNKYDSNKSIFDNLFKIKEKKKDDEDVVEDHNMYLENLGMD